MIEVTKTNVASVAEKPSDSIGLVTVVNVKIPSTTGLSRAAARTLAALLDKHLFVRTKWNPVDGSESVIFSGTRMSFPPFAAFRSRFWQVVLAPRFMARNGAWFAVNGKSVLGEVAFVKFLARLFLFASWAELGRRIGESFLCHAMAPPIAAAKVHTEMLSRCQGDHSC
jgi:hypothetical protein